METNKKKRQKGFKCLFKIINERFFYQTLGVVEISRSEVLVEA